jgi:hypothetical protein
MENILNVRQYESVQSACLDQPNMGQRIPVNGKSPWLIDFLNQKRKKSLDRRKQKRFQIRRGAFCLIRSNPTKLTDIDYMSMGQIAMATLKSRPNKMGQIKDISMDGLSFRYVNPQDRPYESLESAGTDQSLELDILMADCRFYLSNLPFRTIFDVDIKDNRSFNTIKMKHLGVRLGPLMQNQRESLADLIQNHRFREP